MSFTLQHRFVVSPDTLAQVWAVCDRTEDYVWVGAKRAARPQRLVRATLRGVPAKRIDLALLPEWDGQSTMAVEIGQKTGRFDGATRTQIVVRHWYSDRPEQMPPFGWLRITQEDEQGRFVTVSAQWAGGSYLEHFGRLKSDLAGYDLAAIVMWHHSRYYQCVPYEEARLLADGFKAMFPEIRGMTLAEANRLASRELYRLARNLGWRKLTLKEQRRHGVEGQWHREEEIYGSPSGAGEYTLEAAAGLPMREPRESREPEELPVVE